MLSGGGARASFQLGALRYLYDHVGIHPQVMVGTSAGSIIAACLSQYADVQDQSRALRELERLWLSMTSPEQMFAARPWFERLTERREEWMSLVQHEQNRPAPSFSLPKLPSPWGQGTEQAPAEDERRVEDEELTGAALTMHVAMSEGETTTQRLGPSAVLPLLSMLPRLRTAGSDLSVILRGADASRSMYHPGTILMRLLDGEFFTSERTRTSGTTVRIAVVALESGELRYVTETGDMVDRDNRPLPGIPNIDLSLGVLASCAIPSVFAPVRIGDEWYVDGGTREATPAEMAIGPLGADPCYVVVSTPVEPPRADSFESKSMLSILLRSAEIVTDEAERDEIALARSSGAVVVEPELFVHDAITVDPGLLQINRDYGWLRAAETHLGLPRSVCDVHRRAIELRLEALELEADVLAGKKDEETLRNLARVKFLIRDQLEVLDPARLPEGAARWWTDWERHPEQPTLGPTWLTRSARRGPA